MALSDNILAGIRKQFHRVTIAGIPFIPFSPTDGEGTRVTISDIRTSVSLDQPCPVATIDTVPGADWIKTDYPVHVNLGFGGLNRRVFTGTVQPRSRPNVAQGSYECAGELYKAVQAKFDEPRDVGGRTVQEALAAVLDDCGITNYDLSAVPAYTLQATEFLHAGSGLRQIEELMLVDGLRIRETGTGQVIVARYEGAPSASFFREYTTDGNNIRILDGGVSENPNWYLSKVTVNGAWQADGTALSATANNAADSRNIKDIFTIRLIHDQAKLNDAAVRIGGERFRVPQTFRMTVPLDPELETGMTLKVNAPEWDVSGNWLVWAVAHNAAADTTVVQLVGGPQFGGAINLSPIAAFTIAAENQPLGVQRYTFVTLDASASFQPDNVDETLTYDWSGDQDAADSPNIDAQTAEKFTVQIDPTAMSGDVLTVTLVVTNEAGLTATATQEINITPEGTDAIVVGIAAALKTRFGFSGDGGETWNFQTGTDITSCAAGLDSEHVNYAVYGRDNGQIYRTTDGCATAPTSVKSSNSIAIVDLKWDWRDPAKVWALDAECQLWLSADYGATWTEIVDFRSSMSLSTITGERLFLHQDGYTYVGGGTGVTNNGRPFIGRFRSGQAPFGFASVFGGHLQTDLGSGNTNLAIADWHFDTTGGLIIVLENYTAYNSGVRPAYWCPDPMTPTGWKRIGNTEGLDSGVTTAGRVALPGNSGPGYYHLMFNDRDAWHINCSSGTPVATVTADFLDAGFTPNEGLHMADETEGIPSADCHLIAVQDAGGNGAIVKSFDDMVTQADILPGMTTWPDIGNAQGKDVAIGVPGQLATAAKIIVGGLLGSPTERFIAWREGQGSFEAHIFPTNLDTYNFVKIRAITSDLWFGLWFNNATDFGTGAAVRTEDGGATWDDLYAAPTDGGLTRVWQDFCRSADGLLWGLTVEVGNLNHMEIWYSSNNGDTWTESKDDDQVADGGERVFYLTADPLNKNRIYAVGRTGSTLNCPVRTWYTLDGGATWSSNTSSAKVNSSFGHRSGVVALSSHRLVLATWSTNTLSNKATVFTSDDNGATWMAVKTFDDVRSSNAEFIYGPVLSGAVLYVMVEEKSAAPYDIQIWKSVDQGQTWPAAVVSAALGNLPARGSNTDLPTGGMAGDPAEGAIYIFGLGEDYTNNAYDVQKTVGLGWQNVSDSLKGSLTGHSNSYDNAGQGTYGIAVIPS